MNKLHCLKLNIFIKVVSIINRILNKKENLLFLDFDGVINIGNDFKSGKIKKYANYECIKNINQLCLKFNLKIVISSSYRFYGLDYCINYLQNSSLDKSLSIIGAIETERIKHRYLEIFNYLKNNNFTKFIIIDDIDMKCLNKYLVKTDFDTGFNKIKLIEAEKLLNEQ